MATRYPQYVPEFMVYQRTMVRAARNFEGLAWVSYDICYRRKAARCRDLHWSRVDSALYHEAFTGRARSVPRCSLCLSPHYSSGQCAFAPVGSVQVGGQQSTGVSVTLQVFFPNFSSRDRFSGQKRPGSAIFPLPAGQKGRCL